MLLIEIDKQTELPSLTFPEAQRLVGGMVEPVRLPNGDTILVNEEGLLMGLPINTAASLLAGQTLVGPAIYLTKAETKRVLR
jgi:hypothetical protein